MLSSKRLLVPLAAAAFLAALPPLLPAQDGSEGGESIPSSMMQYLRRRWTSPRSSGPSSYSIPQLGPHSSAPGWSDRWSDRWSDANSGPPSQPSSAPPPDELPSTIPGSSQYSSGESGAGASSGSLPQLFDGRIRATFAGHIYVQALINGNITARLVVDTGCQEMLLYGNVARQAYWSSAHEGTSSVSGVTAQSMKVQVVRLRSISVQSAQVNNISAQLSPNSGQGGLADGLLCMNFLNHFEFTIDAKRNRLVIMGER